jgi:DNA-binding YbaB/EbfC family protein
MNIQKMMKQAQKMQEQLLEKQAELATRTVETSVGGGRVTVVATGGGDVVSIKISKEVVDVEMLEDLILSGVKQAIAEGKKMAEGELGKLTSGLGLPPGLGF